MARFTEVGSANRLERRQDRARQAAFEEEREKAAVVEEVEFRASLDLDPVGSLGYEPGKARAVFTPIYDNLGELAGGYSTPVDMRGGREGDSLPKFDPVQFGTEEDLRFGDVYVARDFLDDRTVWEHEFRHRGFNELRNRFTPEEFRERYGDEAADFLFDKSQEEDLVRFMSGEIEGADNTINMSPERRIALSRVMTEAALDVIQEDSNPQEKEQAVSWLRRLIGGKSD